jgi:hypothetical protein
LGYLNNTSKQPLKMIWRLGMDMGQLTTGHIIGDGLPSSKGGISVGKVDFGIVKSLLYNG